jgi:hypothetical protein
MMTCHQDTRASWCRRIPRCVARLAAGLGLVGLGALCGATGAAACEPQVAPRSASVTAAYNPFDPAPLFRDIALEVHNSAGDPCYLAIALYSDAGAATAGPSARLAYGVQSPSGGDILNHGVPTPNISASLAADFAVPGGETVALPLRLAVPAGQVAAPGGYADAIRIALYTVSDGRLIGEPAILPVSFAVDEVLKVSLMGGGQGATLDFGSMSRGATRTVMLRARANLGFKFTISSENGGTMRLRSATSAYATSSADYRIAVNGGATFGLTHPQTVPGSSGATGLGGTNIPVEIVLGETEHLRAGHYRDIVTIAIEAEY